MTRSETGLDYEQYEPEFITRLMSFLGKPLLKGVISVQARVLAHMYPDAGDKEFYINRINESIEPRDRIFTEDACGRLIAAGSVVIPAATYHMMN